MLAITRYTVPRYLRRYLRYRGTGCGRYRGTRAPGWARYRVPQPTTGEATRAPPRRRSSDELGTAGPKDED